LVPGAALKTGRVEEDALVKKPKTGTAGARTILLVDDSPQEKHVRAIMLHTHGYHVESISNVDDAYRFSKAKCPDLVLLALSKNSDGELTLWKRIRRANPRQRIAFLIDSSLSFNPLLGRSVIELKPESQDDFMARIEALFRTA
jgi:DNA-binding response OmpR family regulator